MNFFRGLMGAVRSCNRTDILAAIAIVISVFSMWIAYRADSRAYQANLRGSEAVAAMLLPKVQEIVTSTDTSAMFIETFLTHEKETSNDVLRVGALTLDFLHRFSLPEVALPTEHLALLTHSDGCAATKLAICASQRNDVEADIKAFSTIKENRFTSEQRATLSVLPFRLHRVNEACQEAAKELAVIVPASLVDAPRRGTIGELAAAEEETAKRKEAGLVGELTFGSPKQRQDKK